MWKEFEEGIHLDRIEMKPYVGFIFICGGPSDVREEHPISVRDALQRSLAKDKALIERTRIAEDYKDWSKDGIYTDLLDFESHIAQLSSVIVLILESAGSIAELGLFSAIDGFKEKLLVVVDTTHYDEPSFIRLGPIDYLEKTYQNMAECHRWLDGGRRIDQDALSDIQSDLVAAIRDRLKASVPTRPFNVASWPDVALLICEVVSIFLSLTFKEIQAYLRRLGVEVSDSKLHQFLYILEKLEFLFKEPKGTQRFYISRDERSFVSFEARSQQFDLMRFRLDVMEHYEKKEKKRFRAIQEVRRRHVR